MLVMAGEAEVAIVFAVAGDRLAHLFPLFHTAKLKRSLKNCLVLVDT